MWKHNTTDVTGKHKTILHILQGYVLFFFFWPHCEASGILVPRPGIESVPPAMEGRES